VKAEANESAQLSYWRRELENDGLAVDASELYGEPAACSREEAERLDVDFIVVGSHGHGAVYDLFVGSTAAGLLKKAPCPVLIIPVTGLKPEKSVSCAEPGVEFDDTSNSPPTD
jgi:nucleotide-binding universal stress UspA family protein